MNLEALAIPAFISGILTFLAPCTLPLVPGYLAFISGVSIADLRDAGRARQARMRVILNGVFYVVGFSAVFVFFGTLFGFGGLALAHYRAPLLRMGGLFIIFFGFHLTGIFSRVRFLDTLFSGRKMPLAKVFIPGNPASSFLFGAVFALGWTPCVGPILGTIFILASVSASAASGAILLAIFSLGLAIPFLLIAIFLGSANTLLTKVARHLRLVSIIGGIFLIFLGALLVTDQFGIWNAWFFSVFDFIRYERLINYL